LWSGSGTNKSVPVAACRECYAGEEVATIAKIFGGVGNTFGELF